jgi:hypothetical protein
MHKPFLTKNFCNNFRRFFFVAGLPPAIIIGVFNYLGDSDFSVAVLHAVLSYLFCSLLLAVSGVGFTHLDLSIKWIKVIQFFALIIIGVIISLGYIFIYQMLPLGGWLELEVPPERYFEFFPSDSHKNYGDKLFILGESGLTYSYSFVSEEQSNWVQEDYSKPKEGIISVPYSQAAKTRKLLPPGIILESQVNLAHVHDATLEVIFVRLTSGKIFYRHESILAMEIMLMLFTFPFGGLLSGVITSSFITKLRRDEYSKRSIKPHGFRLDTN